MAGKRSRRWHRRAGLVAAAFVLWAAVSGLVINHGDALDLDGRQLAAPWLLQWYGIAAPPLGPEFPAGGNWVSQWGDRVFLDNHEVGVFSAPLRGALTADGVVVAALRDRVLLLLPDGRLVDELGAEAGVPKPVDAIGQDATGRLFLRGDGAVYAANPSMTRWQEAEARRVTWARQAPLPDETAKAVEGQLRGNGVSAERVLLDLHSGRFLGPWGRFFFDLLGLFGVAVAATGLVIGLGRTR